jgi:hypothetical protein
MPDDLDTLRASVEELKKLVTERLTALTGPPPGFKPFAVDDEPQQGQTIPTAPRDTSFVNPDEPLPIGPIPYDNPPSSSKYLPPPPKDKAFTFPEELSHLLYPLTPPAPGDLPPPPKDFPLPVRIINPPDV